jgi:hypothetical protein
MGIGRKIEHIKPEHQQERLNRHKIENNNHTIDTVIYVETQCGKKPREMVFNILIILGRITISNPGIQPSSPLIQTTPHY